MTVANVQYDDNDVRTGLAAEALPKARVVNHGASGWTLCDDATVKPDGITLAAIASADSGPIVNKGRVLIETHEAVAEGALVIAGANGRVLDSAAAGAGEYVVGKACSASTAAGQYISVELDFYES